MRVSFGRHIPAWVWSLATIIAASSACQPGGNGASEEASGGDSGSGNPGGSAAGDGDAGGEANGGADASGGAAGASVDGGAAGSAGADGSGGTPPDVVDACVPNEPQAPGVDSGDTGILSDIPGQDPDAVVSPEGAPVMVIPPKFETDAFGTEATSRCVMDPSGSFICAIASSVDKSDQEYQYVYTTYNNQDLETFDLGPEHPISVDQEGNAFAGGCIGDKAALVKLRPDGSVEWVVATDFDGVVNTVATAPDGSIYATIIPLGNTEGSGTLVHYSSEGQPIASLETAAVRTSPPYQMHVDCSGTVTVYSYYGLARFDADLKPLFDLCLVGCGDYQPVYMMGLTPDGSGLFTVEGGGIARRDALTGERLWLRTFGTQQKALDPIKDLPASWTGTLLRGTAMTVTSQGVYLAGQYSNEYEGWVTGPWETGFVALYDFAGEQLWFRQFRVLSEDQLEDRLWVWQLLDVRSRGVLVVGHGLSASVPVVFTLDPSGEGPL